MKMPLKLLVLLLGTVALTVQAQTIDRPQTDTGDQATMQQQSQSQDTQKDQSQDMQNQQSMSADEPQGDTRMSTQSNKPAPAPAGTVAREQFTSNIENREPVDDLDSLSADHDKVFFFTDLRDFGGQTVTHHWMHDGEDVADVKFQVGGPRWRVWSSKRLMDSSTGTWTVEVVAENGSVVDKKSFQVTAPQPAPSESMDEGQDMQGGEADMPTTTSEPASTETPETSDNPPQGKDEMEPVTPPTDDSGNGG